jgi:hypothetical protein
MAFRYDINWAVRGARMNTLEAETTEKISRLERFRELIELYRRDGTAQRRTQINKEAHWVRQRVLEAGCFQSFIIGPPPAIGGLIAKNVDAFASMFNPPHSSSLFGEVIDMVDRTIGVLSTTPPPPSQPKAASIIASERKNYAFVAMQIDASRPELGDVLDAIKDAANRCGIQAERIDEAQSNERITDRILASIAIADHVIVDLTDERPNVFYEAGFAHGLGKIPIYIARAGTKLHFDLKDYPVIFFASFKQLKDDLEARLRANASKKPSS